MTKFPTTLALWIGRPAGHGNPRPLLHTWLGSPRHAGTCLSTKIHMAVQSRAFAWSGIKETLLLAWTLRVTPWHLEMGAPLRDAIAQSQRAWCKEQVSPVGFLSMAQG